MSIRVVTGSCLDVLPTLAECSVDLIATDPPFNIGFHYDVYQDKRSRADYLAFVDQWLREAVRVLSPVGSMWVAIGDEYAAEYKVRLDALGLTMRNWCIWHYTFGTHQKKKFGRDHTHLLYFVRDPNRFTFNADLVRVESERQRAGDKRADPRGRVPGDVWHFPRLPGNAKERTGHPCQMPESVLERIVLACSHEGDLVLDPFAGSGTTLAVAQRLDREAIGIELSADYAARIEERLARDHHRLEAESTAAREYVMTHSRTSADLPNTDAA
ncbi:DNA adenine methyltransferase YhdJ [Gemmata sp. SH-PL17]|uniref:DNA-methyltransferase n=1 Tax=Gemmata sp. SH-PL17 TaxID=1630693 RepID=UPI00078EA7E0|nr:site-specific DNA-methyltransferase [Gemmata sp. SH-PL17]AMV25477.1 DNA adenine methyltransferase YhdJ [Gemmata sp. SH-PL17]